MLVSVNAPARSMVPHSYSGGCACYQTHARRPTTPIVPTFFRHLAAPRMWRSAGAAKDNASITDGARLGLPPMKARGCDVGSGAPGTVGVWCALSGLALTAAACTSSPSPPPMTQNGPPSIAQVRDGIGADVDNQDVRSSLFANWDAFLDPEGLPVVYEWSIGTKPGGDDVLPWTEVGGSTRASTTGVELPLGVPLHVNVRATDLADSRSAVSTSDGVVIGERVARSPTLTSEPGAVAAPSGHLVALDRFGTTWTFDRPVQAGRFVNGDWWVIGPVSIVAISPQAVVDGTRVRHGSMIDPDPKSLTQGYDNAMFGDGAGGRYDGARNVALGVSRDQPLTLAPGCTLVTATSAPLGGQVPQLESCALLTCLAEPPPNNAFRPPYCGTDKRCRWTADTLDLSRLAQLESTPGAPTIEELVDRFERTWLDHTPGWTGRYLHPRANMPDYGRDLADLVGQAALVLQLEHKAEQKRPLAIALVQFGIDCYGIVQSGGRFLADGGSGSGRKFPVLLAGTLLNDDALLQLAKDQKFAFAEDAQTFLVTETSSGVWNHGHGGYTVDDEGLPEWGNRHADDPRFDSKSWTGDPHRRCCTANAMCGYVLAARIMGLKDAWSHDALFDYVDRYMQIEPRGSWTRAWTPFVERMWDKHRSSF